MTANASQGVLLQVGDAASPEGFTTIGEVTGFTDQQGRTEITVTSLADTHDKYLMGTRNGQITLTGNWDGDDATHTTLQTKFDAGTAANFRLMTTSASPAVGREYECFVTEYSRDGGVNQAITFSVTLRKNAAGSAV